MKKLLAILLMVTIILTLVGCDIASVEKESQNEPVSTEPTSMFIQVENAGTWHVVYHRDTKVMYAVSNGGYNGGTFTLLVDADGNPMTWKNEKIENN